MKGKMILKTVKVTEKGQIAIPLEIRNQAKINKGDELIVFNVDDKILLEKSKKISIYMEDDFKDMLKLSEKTLRKLWDNKEDEIWGRYDKK